ncbi:hypothetical protein [Spirosoma rhododendri]|uniref:Uncharacterized protein n=1 Tax=Spirosoma rhododendri TaxID=2728024 RepID=A0A7L5DRK0_9BACT|nr:hypothetical protein [Spirosoma rhododendri]QJD81046.1 hypothetical protein HH216_23435 [Spirosoma rhododendri]
MNKKNILVAAGLLFLATACKENKVIVPTSPTVQKETPAPKLQGDVLDDDVVDTPKGKPAKVKDLTPEKPYEAYPALN